MAETITIPGRFNGPPRSANGGYASGAVAALLGGSAEVTLRRPPPLDLPLGVEREGERVLVRDGETLVAEAEAIDPFELAVPAAVSVADAEAARERYAGFREHAYATCYVCGPERSDGLAIFPGPVAGRELVAAPWTPAGGAVPDEIVWAALDCPSSAPVASPGNRPPIVLARLAVERLRPVATGDSHVLLSWSLGADGGRKRGAGVALYSASGEPVALGRALWIALER